MLCDDLEGVGWVVEGRLKRDGIYVYIWLICAVQQKPTQHCKVIIHKFKKKNKVGIKAVRQEIFCFPTTKSTTPLYMYLYSLLPTS